MTAPPHRPLTADDIRPGDPYELSDGRLVECLPTGRRGGRRNGAGFAVLDADPAVETAGVDVGTSPRKDMLRAPDVSVGGDLADEPGWATVAPPLAVEYADTGQDEAELQKKIGELLSEGTRWIWVVRLQGSPRVEVYEPSADDLRKGIQAVRSASPRRSPREPARIALPGELLTAPGILQNPVPVEALYDRDTAHEMTLRNLLQRKGYADLDAVRAEGREEALRTGIRDLCEMLDLALSPERSAAIDALNEEALLALRDHLKRRRSLP